MDDDALVRDYLGRLEAAAWPLTPDRRTELLGEVREHIETALGEAGQRDQATVRNVLDRLGRPEDIVSEEAGGSTPAAAASTAQAPMSVLGVVEIIGLRS